jgi:hypothetical protein
MFRFEEGYNATRKLLQENKMPASELERIKGNMVHYEGKMKEMEAQKREYMANMKQQKSVSKPVIKTKSYKKKKVRS